MATITAYNKAGKSLKIMHFPEELYFTSSKKARKFIYERAAKFKLPGSIKNYNFVAQGYSPEIPVLVLSESCDAAD